MVKEIKGEDNVVRIGQNRYSIVEADRKFSKRDIQQKMADVNAMVYVIDTDDDSTRREAKQELDIVRALNMAHNLPLAILGNKGLVDLAEFKKELNIGRNKAVGKG